jgi:hypothetical protein
MAMPAFPSLLLLLSTLSTLVLLTSFYLDRNLVGCPVLLRIVHVWSFYFKELLYCPIVSMLPLCFSSSLRLEDGIIFAALRSRLEFLSHV